jgi:hypothetical protein
MAAVTLRSAAIAAVLALADQTTAAATGQRCPGRFGWENQQLTDAAVGTDKALFGFGCKDRQPKPVAQCKVFPGDADWPSQTTWSKINATLDGALIQTVPLAASCYRNRPEYDVAACQHAQDNWKIPAFHVNDPASALFPLYQGRTCMPTDDPDSSDCTLGGYAAYSVAATKVSQIQLAVNVARNANLRLVVKNTGHDFADKSIGAGALSIWTHKLNDIKFLPDYNCRGRSGPAFKLGAGVVTQDVYAAAEANGVTVAGGECRTVGIAGGFTAGGGHSPISPLVGMGADQVLSLDVVLPDGKFVTVNEDSYPDLFWALRGGGGSKFLLPIWSRDGG